jgi:putative tricarboxylic transport membrane protein
MRRRDLASGFALAILGLLVTHQASRLTYRDEFGPGPGLLPFWLGLILAALAGCLVISAGIRKGSKDSKEHSDVSVLSKFLRVFPAWLGLIATVAVLNVLGFVASLGLFSFFLVYQVERRSLKSAIVVSVAITLSFLFVFRVILPVPLPLNAWGF